MALTKKLINEFIYKVKNKALQAVREKHNAVILTLITEEYTKQPGLLEEIQKTEVMMLAAGTQLDKLLNGLKELYADKNSLRDFNSVSHIEAFRTHILQKYTDETKDVLLKAVSFAYPPVTDKIKEAYTARGKEISETEAAYRRVYTMIDSAPSAKKAYDKLKELGFDVTWIDEAAAMTPEAITIDTNKLFPCGDNK